MKQLPEFLKDPLFKIVLLRISIGIIYIWFGALKFFPDLSPAESIARDTIQFLTFDLLDLNIGYLILALWELSIGILLIFNSFTKFAVILALTHMVLTFTPFIAFTDSTFEKTPYAFTLLGQYILKNIVIIFALIIVYPKKRIIKLIN